MARLSLYPGAAERDDAEGLPETRGWGPAWWGQVAVLSCSSWFGRVGVSQGTRGVPGEPGLPGHSVAGEALSRGWPCWGSRAGPWTSGETLSWVALTSVPLHLGLSGFLWTEGKWSRGASDYVPVTIPQGPVSGLISLKHEGLFSRELGQGIP